MRSIDSYITGSAQGVADFLIDSADRVVDTSQTLDAEFRFDKQGLLADSIFLKTLMDDPAVLDFVDGIKSMGVSPRTLNAAIQHDYFTCFDFSRPYPKNGLTVEEILNNTSFSQNMHALVEDAHDTGRFNAVEFFRTLLIARLCPFTTSHSKLYQSSGLTIEGLRKSHEIPLPNYIYVHGQSPASCDFSYYH
ncbi:MAG: hypothetical protein ACLFU1_02870 [Alphaproteobacteria bacterium]